ncbi:cytochrome bc complex cytochrome b subunit [Nakamurella flavida]|uniref:Cytochrome bc1 complex cytochrome b subunit n=1 Tax=Nakamurella flavida TaxID=363630 RepID=A0A938YEA2_9ACTN|nr:cytochrome bc complex cytochrome b subunit [Nakamurella flavida]MBM9476075.1 cytochrome bc complex cytochrome b subunit [Nakamurella flavida]MDP9777180.1 ubiquinol-cytochrome c reductase cytochrome b subunit [Nakamurella flavida]
MSRLTTPTKPKGPSIAAKGLDEADIRYHGARPLRTQLNKVFPSHWSFMLGEACLYSFVILLLSGVYLTLFYDASMTETVYQGVYDKLRGVPMSMAYASTLDISFDVRGGLLIRQIHHWAALIFLFSIMIHMMRVFFTGGFRKPREANWVIGVLLLVLAMAEGFLGYSLPDDLLSGTGLRAVSAFILSIPVIGTWMHWAVFGGDYPGDIVIGRFYSLHILLIPGILLALIGVHLALVWFQKHTQFPGPRATEKNVVGVRILPTFAAKGGGFFGIVFGVIVAMAGVFQINPIWNLGPYNPSQVSAGVQPDFYMGFLDGMVRVWPNWEVRNIFGHYMIPAVFFPAILGSTILLIIVMMYPWIETAFTKDKAMHNLLQRPRDVPVRTALGAAFMAFYIINLINGANDLIAFKFDISLNVMTWAGRIGSIVGPVIVYIVTYRLCLGLQHSDRAVLEHGIETGIIKRLPSGQFVEIHQPLGGVDSHGHPIPLAYQGASVPKRMNQLGSAGAPVPGIVSPKDNRGELEFHDEMSGSATER